MGLRKHSIRRIDNNNVLKSSNGNGVNDLNLKYSRDDTFLGTFREGKVILQRFYIEHTKTTRIYATKLFHRSKAPVAQMIFVHGWACSSNFLEVKYY